MAGKDNSRSFSEIIKQIAEDHGLQRNGQLPNPTETEIDFLNSHSCGWAKRLPDDTIIFLHANRDVGHLTLIHIREKTKEELSKEKEGGNRHPEKIAIIPPSTLVYPPV